MHTRRRCETSSASTQCPRPCERGSVTASSSSRARAKGREGRQDRRQRATAKDNERQRGRWRQRCCICHHWGKDLRRLQNACTLTCTISDVRSFLSARTGVPESHDNNTCRLKRLGCKDVPEAHDNNACKVWGLVCTGVPEAHDNNKCQALQQSSVVP